MLENLTFQSFAKCLLRVCSTLPPRICFQNVGPSTQTHISRPRFFVLVTPGVAKLFTLCCHRHFLNRGKAPRSEVFIVICPHLLLEAGLVLSGQKRWL